MHVHTDREYSGKLDDQVELLEMPCRPVMMLLNDRPPTSRVSITGEEMDSEFSKQRWCNESLESAATPPLATKH